MLLLLLLALGASTPASTPLLSVYYRTAVEYRTGDRAKALREIRRWGPREIRECVQALREEADREEKMLAPTGEVVAELPVEIDFGTVEAAALMHVEVGLAHLQSLAVPSAESHLSAATTLVEWSRELAAERLEERADLLQKLRRRSPSGELDPALSDAIDRALLIELKIDPPEYYSALAAATLAVSFPELALPLAEKATKAAPLDGETLLLDACVKETLATAEQLRSRGREARRLRREAEALLRRTLAADPDEVEAHLRLGHVLLVGGRPGEAEPLLQQAAEQPRNDRQRYLALLLLGRSAELRESPDEAAAFYRRALAAWPDSQAARLALARCLEASAGPNAARPLVMASLLESRQPAREADPWWSYSFGPHGLAKALVERLWQATLGRPFGS